MRNIFSKGHAATCSNWIRWQQRGKIVNPFCFHTSALFHSSGLICLLTPPAIRTNSFACIPVDRCNQRSLQRAPLNTRQCFTSQECAGHASLHNSHLQNQSDTGHREERLQRPYLCVCIHNRLPHNMHISERAPRRVLQREGPLGRAGLKDVKNAFSSSVCQCVSTGRGYLR